MSGRRGRPPHQDVLTPAEWQVVECVRHGLTNRQIAGRRGTSAEVSRRQRAAEARLLQAARAAAVGRRETRQPASWTGGKNERDEAWSHRADRAKVSDIRAAEAWYRDVLALPHLYTFGNLAFFDMGGVRLFLAEGESGPAESILYFKVPDVHAAHRALIAKGVEFHGAPHLIHRHSDGTEEWMAFFNDNEGRPLAIMAQVRTPDA